MERTPEAIQIDLTAAQLAIEGINDRILLLQMQRERYEQVGHMLVAELVEVRTHG
jgi:hypothetical protein